VYLLFSLDKFPEWRYTDYVVSWDHTLNGANLMTSKQKATITVCWNELRDAIDAAYKNAPVASDESSALRDYAQNISWHDSLDRLLRDETENEKQHRSTRSIRGFSSRDAARLILMNNIARGSFLPEMPSALTFITFRKSAAEANLLGYLIRHSLKAEWCQTVDSLSYTDLMKDAEVSA
jgi:hypothetical protein